MVASEVFLPGSALKVAKKHIKFFFSHFNTCILSCLSTEIYVVIFNSVPLPHAYCRMQKICTQLSLLCPECMRTCIEPTFTDSCWRGWWWELNDQGSAIFAEMSHFALCLKPKITVVNVCGCLCTWGISKKSCGGWVFGGEECWWRLPLGSEWKGGTLLEWWFCAIFPPEMFMSLMTSHLRSLVLSFQLCSMRLRPPVL